MNNQKLRVAVQSPLVFSVQDGLSFPMIRLGILRRERSTVLAPFAAYFSLWAYVSVAQFFPAIDLIDAVGAFSHNGQKGHTLFLPERGNARTAPSGVCHLGVWTKPPQTCSSAFLFGFDELQTQSTNLVGQYLR